MKTIDTNEHLKYIAKALNLSDTCSNCLLYNRGTRCCEFDGTQIDNPNCMQGYCKWWVPDKWMQKAYKKTKHYNRSVIEYIKNVDELKKIRENRNKKEETIIISESLVPYPEPSSNESESDNQYNNQTEKESSFNDNSFKNSALWNYYLELLF